MRQSIITYMRDQLKSLGFHSTKELPGAFHEDYEPLWFRFQQMRAIKELANTFKSKVVKDYILVVGFASYVESYESVGYNFNTDASNLLKAQFKQSVNTINSFIRKARLTEGLKVTKLSHDLEYTTSDLLNVALAVHLEGFVWLEPKSAVINLNDFLYSLKGSLYEGDLPEKLKFTKNTASQLMASTALWYPAFSTRNLKIFVGRTRGSMLMLKYEVDFNSLPIFFGTHQTAVDRELSNLWATTFKVG